MALQLLKIVAEVDSQVKTNPEDARFFYITETDIDGGDSLIIDAADFLDDTGNAVVELPALETNNSYFNVYINGVLQMEGISTYTLGETEIGNLKIDVPEGTLSIIENSPVVLEVLNYTPTSDNFVNT